MGIAQDKSGNATSSPCNSAGRTGNSFFSFFGGRSVTYRLKDKKQGKRNTKSEEGGGVGNAIMGPKNQEQW